MTTQVRVVVHDGDRAALVLGVEHNARELYAFAPTAPDVRDLRESIHGTGLSHIHTPAGRLLHEPRPPLADWKGYAQLLSSAPDLNLLSWDYRPKRPSERRHLMHLDVAAFGQTYPSCTVSAFGVEAGAEHLVDEVLSAMPVLIGSLVVRREQPWIVVVAWAITWEAARSLDAILPMPEPVPWSAFAPPAKA